MTNNKITICLFFFITILIARETIGATLFDPGLKWNSIKTRHFLIHYHQGLEFEALRLSLIAEKVHIRLTSDIQWIPELRTDVILVDNTDSANGYATPYPFNRIQIYITRPAPNGSNSNFDDWLEMVFTHEYVHILNIDTVHGIPQAGRYVLGRNPIFYPNLFQPIWIIEGNAVFHESKRKPFGRNNSTYTDMVLRTEVASGTFKSIDNASSYPREWPGGAVPYLYGGLFVEYLENTYGENSFALYMHRNADNIVPFSDNIYPIPFLFNRDAHKTYGKPFFMLWKEWKKHIIRKQTDNIAKITQKGLTPLKHISKPENNSILPRFSNDGNAIYYITKSQKKGNHLLTADKNTGKTKRLCIVNSPAGLAVGKNDILYITDKEYYKTFSLYNEAFTYNNSYRKISSSLRAICIEPMRKTNKCLIITSKNNRYSLIRCDNNMQNRHTIIDESLVQMACLRVSPDETKAIFTIKEDNGNTDLVIMDLAAMTFIRLTNDIYNDIDPVWHTHGNKIIFVSDRSGVYNLHEYDLSTQMIKRITNVTGGIFSPDLTPDGNTIVVASYEKQGHQIALIDYPEESFEKYTGEPEIIDLTFFKAGEPDNSQINISESQKYSPWSSIFPAYFIPILGLYEIYPENYDVLWGVQVTGSDTLYRHSYALSFFMFFRQMRLGIDVSYTCSVLYPDITIGYYDDTLFFEKDPYPWESENDTSMSRRLYRYGYLSHYIPFTHFNIQQSLQFTYYIQQEFLDRYIYPVGVFNEVNILGKMQIVYSLNTARVYDYSISKEHGMDFRVVADIYNTYLGSDYSFYKLHGIATGYFPGFYSNNVFMLQFRGGICLEKDDERPYTIGRYTANFIGAPRAGENALGIRGYPAGTVEGNRIIASTAELRLPVVQKDAGILTVPIMFRDFWFTVFFDYGNVFNNIPDFTRFRYSAGIEAHIRLTLGYNVDFTAYIGYAHGWTKYGEDQVYFALSPFIEGTVFGSMNKASQLKPVIIP